MSEDEKSKAWWQTLPAILTGLAAVVAAITGLVTVLRPTPAEERAPVDLQQPRPAEGEPSSGVAGVPPPDAPPPSVPPPGAPPPAAPPPEAHDVRLRIHFGEKSRDTITVAFVDAEPDSLPGSGDLEGSIRQKFSFVGNAVGSGEELVIEESLQDVSFLDSVYVIAYNEGTHGWDGTIQLYLDRKLIFNEKIAKDLKHFHKPRKFEHYYWSARLKDIREN